MNSSGCGTFELMSYLVYYPLIWRLERERGFVLLHAHAHRPIPP